LCEFLIIPEAHARSGALITARCALSLGRKVLVHIGIGKSSAWDGCYTLLREGAEVFKCIEDVLGLEEGSSELLDFLRIPRSVEEIMEFTGADYDRICTLLTELELQGKVRRMGSLFCA